MVWTFSDSLTGDGGVVSGSFTYNADTNAFSNVSVTVTGGTVAPGSIFTQAVNVGTSPTDWSNSTGLQMLTSSYTGGDMTGALELYFYFLSPMTNAGGTITIDGIAADQSPQLAHCYDSACQYYDDGLRFANGSANPGVITAPTIPEPASMILLGTAIIGLATRSRRRARTLA